jgi:O-antigen ligase
VVSGVAASAADVGERPLAGAAARALAWVAPAFVALTWMSLPGHIWGGLPSPVELGGIVLLGAAVVVAPRRPEITLTTVTVCALLTLAWLGTGLLATEGVVVPRDELRALAFLIIVALVVGGAAGVERTVIALAATGVFLGVGAVYSVLGQPTELFPLNTDPATGIVEPRAAGPFGEANFFAFSLALLVAPCTYLGTRGGARSALGILATVALLAGILATGSRGGMLAALTGLLGYLIFAGDRRTRMAGLGAILAAAAMLPLFATQASGSADRPVSGRATESLVAVHMFIDHPLTGVGPSRYPALYRDYAREIGNDPRSLREAHSLPLEVAAEQGITGLAAWAAAAVVVAAYARRRRLWATALGRAIVLALVTYGVGSLFLHSSQLRLLFVLVGLLLALGPAEPARRPNMLNQPGTPEPAR